MPSLKPEQLEASIRSGKLKTLYLFDGPENYLKERAVERIIERLLPPEAHSFNLDRFDGNTASPGDVVNAGASLPFMAPRRVVVVRSAEEFSAPDGRLIAESLSNLPETTCFLFLYQGKGNLREEIPAQVASLGDVVTFWTPFPNQLPAWVATEVRNRGKTIAMDAAAAIGDACANLQEIVHEIDKICLFVGNKPHIAMADVVAHGLPDEEGDFRKLEDALWDRNLGEALNQGRLLSESGVRPEIIFPVVERVLRTLLLGQYYAREKGWSPTDILQTLRIRGMSQQGKFTTALKKYTPEELQASLRRLAETDFEMKTGRLPGPEALSLWLVNLLRPAERSYARR